MVNCHNSDLLKVDLHSIRYPFAFARFFFAMKNVFVFFRIFICPYRTNKIVTYWTKVFQKHFLKTRTALF